MPTQKRKSINQVLAANIAAAMERRHIKTQEELAKASGVAQRTISNYLNPEKRAKGKSGKEPSAKLTEIEQIAKALDTEAWDLLRELTPRERAFYRRIEDAYKRLDPEEPIDP